MLQPFAAFAETVGADELARTQELITAIQADKRRGMLDTLALSPEQLGEFLPIYDEYQAEMKVPMPAGTSLGNRLFVADCGGMTGDSAKQVLLDLAVAVSVPIVTKAPNTIN